MSRGRRLTETDRLSIAKERAQGVAAADLARRYGVSLKTIYNAANHALDRQNANGSRPIVIGLRVSRRELAAFDAALARHGITNRTDALRHLVLAADEILEPDHALTEALSARAADISRIGNNINQVARRLNEARLKGQPLSYTDLGSRHLGQPCDRRGHRDLGLLRPGYPAQPRCDLSHGQSEMIRPLAPLIRLFFSDLIASLQAQEPSDDEPWPVMIMFDEFDRLGKRPIVAESIKTLRSFGGNLAIVTQTIPALDEIYGENTRRSLQGGAGVKLTLPRPSRRSSRS